MQSFAVSANGSMCFLFDQKVYLSHFSKAKYAETRFVKINEYTDKRKKTIELRTTPTFLSAIIHENTTYNGTVLVKS